MVVMGLWCLILVFYQQDSVPVVREPRQELHYALFLSLCWLSVTVLFI